MQLTKDDVKSKEIILGELEEKRYEDIDRTIKYLDFSKFLEVRKFYEDYKESKNAPMWLWKLYNSEPLSISFSDWLFNYCFVEGLK